MRLDQSGSRGVSIVNKALALLLLLTLTGCATTTVHTEFFERDKISVQVSVLGIKKAFDFIKEKIK